MDHHLPLACDVNANKNKNKVEEERNLLHTDSQIGFICIRKIFQPQEYTNIDIFDLTNSASKQNISASVRKNKIF